MRWNLRLAAANRGIWKASELQRMLAERDLVISAGKMSGLWSGDPASIKLSDLDVICAVLDCGVGELLIPEPDKVSRAVEQQDQPVAASSSAGPPVTPGGATGARFLLPEVPPRRSRPGAASCIDCLAWGVLHSRRCGSCSVWRHKHPGEAGCAGCGRILAVKDGYCRLCWQQARYQARLAGGLPRGAVSVLEDGERLRYHQLFFDRMQVRRPDGPVHQHGRRGAPPKPPPAPAGRPACRWIQARLFEARRDFTRFDESTGADLGNPWLAWGLYLAWRRGEARGWRRGVRFGVRRALIIVLSRHEPGDTVRYSEIIPVQQALGISAGRVAEVLQEMGVLDDDRRPSFESWLERKLEGLAPGIRADVEAWLRTMRDGGPRSRPRDIASAWNHMN